MKGFRQAAMTSSVLYDKVCGGDGPVRSSNVAVTSRNHISMRSTPHAIAIGLFAFFVHLTHPTSAAPQPGRPNILWLVSEDNHLYLGCYGDPRAHTPTIDKLAKEGVLYEKCF